MLKFKEFVDLQEEFKVPKDTDSLLNWYKNIMKLCYKYDTASLVWRGINGVPGNLSLIINNRESYMGRIDPVIDKHIKNLKSKFGIKQPIFATQSKHQASFFGSAYVMIPVPPFVCLWSPVVKDSAEIDNEERYTTTKLSSGAIFRTSKSYSGPNPDNKIYDTYEKIENIMPSEDWEGELIFDCKEYYVFSPNKELKTYKDLANNLYSKIKSIENS